jgi:hypothetical protein
LGTLPEFSGYRTETERRQVKTDFCMNVLF